MSAEKKAALQIRGKEDHRAKVLPAYATLLKFLREEYFPHAQNSTAAYDLPDGRAFIKRKLKPIPTFRFNARTNTSNRPR